MIDVRPQRVVLLDDCEILDWDRAMEFRLTYQGPLVSSQPDDSNQKTDKKADQKHAIRKQFHKQLKRLWETTPFLNGDDDKKAQMLVFRPKGSEDLLDHKIETLAEHFQIPPFKFVPLVIQQLDLLVGLDVLFLRPDKPGNLWRGDLDNRMKTLLDALRVPKANEGYANRVPDSEETPFFVLLEDDELISKLSVETDRLLEPSKLEEVKLVITVRLRPYSLHPENMPFGG